MKKLQGIPAPDIKVYCELPKQLYYKFLSYMQQLNLKILSKKLQGKMENIFDTPFGYITVNREKEETNRTLQGWNSADSYILNRFAEDMPEKDSAVLVMNDSYGALSIALSGQFNVSFQSDSVCSEKNCRNNIKENNPEFNEIKFLKPDDIPEGEITRILLKIPKNLNYLEYQLQYISSHFPQGIPVIASGMVKDVHKSTIALFDYYMNDTEVSLAWKKARLLQGMTKGPVEAKNKYPVSYRPQYEEFNVLNYPNLFAFGRLDPGAAFMLSNFPRVKNAGTVVDLACGDGIFALKAALLWKDAQIICTDESYLALKSAQESFEENGLKGRAEFLLNDSLEGFEEASADVILCNPPFHMSRSVTTSAAIKMFRDSFKSLKKGGELFIVANSHLGYDKALGKIFGKVNVVRNSKKFIIIRAVK